MDVNIKIPCNYNTHRELSALKSLLALLAASCQRSLPALLSFFCFSICLLVMLSRSRFRFSYKHHKIFISGLWIKQDEQLSDNTNAIFQLTLQPSCNKACQTWLKSKQCQQVVTYSLQKSMCAFQKPSFFQTFIVYVKIKFTDPLAVADKQHRVQNSLYFLFPL